MNRVDLDQVFRSLYLRARALYPELPASPLDSAIDPKGRTSPRSFAWFRFPEIVRVQDRDPNRCKVAMSPDLAKNEGNAYGVLAHELGHAVDHLVGRPELTRRLAHVARPDGAGTVADVGLPESAERLADLLGETILGSPIWYDIATIQTSKKSPGIYRPRPDWLG